ncbi:MAG: diadenylate cyclase DacZ [Halobacteriales archaeon]|nr:diadenylate cyclase DacZ [Halobacteriales archaeon]
MAQVRAVVEGIIDDADAVLLFSPSTAEFDRVSDTLDDDVDVILVAPSNTVDSDLFVSLPLEFEHLKDRVRFAMAGAISQEIIDEGDVIVCLATMFDDELDTVTQVRANKSPHSSVYDLFVNSRADPEVIRDVFDVVIELGKKGQKGEPVGALFVVGDAGKVMNKSRPLSYNPFEKSHVHVGDPIVNVMLKEFSRLDGAFVISDSGKIVSAYRYLEPSAEGVDIPKGLGTRHMAAGAISRDTNAVSIVLSESDGLVRAFKGGELILEVDPEDY